MQGQMVVDLAQMVEKEQKVALGEQIDQDESILTCVSIGAMGDWGAQCTCHTSMQNACQKNG